jgi:hypothetical protein
MENCVSLPFFIVIPRDKAREENPYLRSGRRELPIAAVPPRRAQGTSDGRPERPNTPELSSAAPSPAFWAVSLRTGKITGNFLESRFELCLVFRHGFALPKMSAAHYHNIRQKYD